MSQFWAVRPRQRVAVLLSTRWHLSIVVTVASCNVQPEGGAASHPHETMMRAASGGVTV